MQGFLSSAARTVEVGQTGAPGNLCSSIHYKQDPAQGGAVIFLGPNLSPGLFSFSTHLVFI